MNRWNEAARRDQSAKSDDSGDRFNSVQIHQIIFWEGFQILGITTNHFRLSKCSESHRITTIQSDELRIFMPKAAKRTKEKKCFGEQRINVDRDLGDYWPITVLTKVTISLPMTETRIVAGWRQSPAVITVVNLKQSQEVSYQRCSLRKSGRKKATNISPLLLQMPPAVNAAIDARCGFVLHVIFSHISLIRRAT